MSNISCTLKLLLLFAIVDFKIMGKKLIHLDKWTEESMDSILREASGIEDTGERIDFLSKQFLETPYKESTLAGDSNTPEIFVINLEAVDCFTFIDYIEAMRLSASLSDFKETLKKVRYQSGEVAYKNRNHFFTDWIESNPGFVSDATGLIGGEKTHSIIKMLNQKGDGAYFLEGIQPKQRELKYIPSVNIDDSVIENLKTGDYIGIYSDTPGLDVSHVGIFIKYGHGIFLRHASSVTKKVLDEDFKSYITGKPGIIVLRARPPYS